MSLGKYISRFKRMHGLIKRRSTGTPEEFAEKMGLSRSQLFLVIADMKELGFPIEYDNCRHSYYYSRDGEFMMGFMESELSTTEIRAVKGGWGTNLFEDLTKWNRLYPHSPR